MLRWIGIAIKDETGATVYRISGDNFAAVLTGASHEDHEETARKLFERLNGEAIQLALAPPVVRMVVIHFPAGARLHPAVVWKNLNEQLELTSAEQPLCVVHADIREEDSAALHAVELMAKRIGTLGSTLQYAFRLAYTDPLTHSPNMLAIQRKLDRWELEHLRKLAAMQADQIEDLQQRLESAESWAESWRQEALQLHTDLADAVGGARGITQTGKLIVVGFTMAKT